MVKSQTEKCDFHIFHDCKTCESYIAVYFACSFCVWWNPIIVSTEISLSTSAKWIRKIQEHHNGSIDLSIHSIPWLQIDQSPGQGPKFHLAPTSVKWRINESGILHERHLCPSCLCSQAEEGRVLGGLEKKRGCTLIVLLIRRIEFFHQIAPSELHEKLNTTLMTVH